MTDPALEVVVGEFSFEGTSLGPVLVDPSTGLFIGIPRKPPKRRKKIAAAPVRREEVTVCRIASGWCRDRSLCATAPCESGEQEGRG